MNMDRVTVTGADESVKPGDLIDLSVKYPFVEWAILVSHSSSGTRRFPHHQWINELQQQARVCAEAAEIKLSLHVCGRWIRNLLVGRNDVPSELLHGFQRVQLNFHGESNTVAPARFSEALRIFGSRQIIFQIDGNAGHKLLAGAAVDEDHDYVPLFDVSHGAGVLPTSWPPPFEEYSYHGYAGGLGPDNLAEQIPWIAIAAGGARFWIDMETRVRSEDDRTFDLAKVERCLRIAEPFVMEVQGAL